MPSATKAAANRGLSHYRGNLLSAKSLRKGSISVHIKGAHEAPRNWNSGLILDFVMVDGYTACALNRTNLNILIESLGDNYDKWAGYTAEFAVIDTEFGGKSVKGLKITKLSDKPKKLPKEKDDEDVPF